MKNLDDNIINLTSLWKTVGTTAGTYFEQENFCFSAVPNAQWPNKLWLKNPLSNELLKEIKLFVQQYEHPLVISVWSDFENENQNLFKQHEFIIKSEQIGMSLTLKGKFTALDRTAFKRVYALQEAAIWEVLYPQSFGYIISAATVIQTKEQLDYYLIYLDKEAIGTAILFETETTIGIHGVGIIPSYRKQGFAEEVMLKLLNIAIDRKKTHVTLQASTLGKNIYKKIGFTEDFLMTNYTV